MPNPAQLRDKELSTAGLSGHDLRRAQKLNDTLKRTRLLVHQSGQEPEQSIALLVAETRVLVLGMGRYEFAQAANMHFHAVKNVESPGSQPQHESLSRVYRMWNRFATRDRRPSRVHPLLEEACRKLLALLVPEQDEQGRPLRRTVEGLYWRWMYQAGRAAFVKASMQTSRQRKPLTYGAFWQRREVGMVPDFEEVRIIGKVLARDLDEAGTIWSEQKTGQLLKRGVTPPLVRLIVAMQIQCRGLRMTAASIGRHFKVAEKVAQAIKNGRMVALHDVRDVIRAVIPQREASAFAGEWNAAWERLQEREGFASAFRRICAENGWSNHMIARLLRVRAPEERDDDGPSTKQKTRITRAEPYRPSADVRRMYQENAFSAQCPARAAIELIARDDVFLKESGESQREYLARLFLEGVDRQLLQKGSGARGSALRKHRIFCGTTPEQLAEVSGYTKDDILLIERGLREVSSSEERRLLRLAEQFPMQKVEETRKQLARLTSAPTAVTETVTLLKERHGGYIPLSRLLHDEEDHRFSFPPYRLKRIEAGEEVPALPLLRRMVARGGSEVTPELVRDWYEQMPGYLVEHPKLRWRHPLVRGFGIVVYEKWTSLHQFWKEHFEGDFSHSVLTRNFQQLNGGGKDIAWPMVSRYLNAAGVRIRDARRLFWQRLFQRKDEISDAINGDDEAAAGHVVQGVIAQWREEVSAEGGDPKAVEHMLGLMSAERANKPRK